MSPAYIRDMMCRKHQSSYSEQLIQKDYHTMPITISWGICIIALALAVNAFPADLNFVEVHDLEEIQVPPLSPEDPAVNSFPKIPTAPVIPTCVQPGYRRDPFNCAKFYFCEHSQAVPVAFYCQSGLIFNPQSNSCEYPRSEKC